MSSGIRFESLFKNPKSLLDYYKGAKTNPLGFVANLNLKEDLQFAVYASLIMASITSISTILSLSIFKIVFFFFGCLAGIFISALFTAFAAWLSKANIDYHECINLNVHISILMFPISLFAKHFTPLTIVSSLLGCYFLYLALVKRFKGNDVTVKVICFVIMLLTFGSVFSW